MSKNMIVSICAILALATAAQANLITDPGFEGLSPTGTYGAGVYLGGHTDGWLCRTVPNGYQGTYLYWDLGAPQHQYLHLNNALVQQVFNTVAGASYDVSFKTFATETAVGKYVDIWMDAGNTVGVSNNGDLFHYNTGAITMSWETYSFSFMATSAQTTISVRGNLRLAVDDFSVEQQITVPEPATMSLLAIGGLAALIRRKRS
ncbi:MAG: DUF642 domain-containing protein [Planctomycetaceae bacterium]|nr:DUF642 domain-containing protein [Planctomycetaceae bacterium]